MQSSETVLLGELQGRFEAVTSRIFNSVKDAEHRRKYCLCSLYDPQVLRITGLKTAAA